MTFATQFPPLLRTRSSCECVWLQALGEVNNVVDSTDIWPIMRALLLIPRSMMHRIARVPSEETGRRGQG